MFKIPFGTNMSRMSEAYKNKLDIFPLTCTSLILYFISFGYTTLRPIEKNYKKIDCSDDISKPEPRRLSENRIFYKTIHPPILDNTDTIRNPYADFLNLEKNTNFGHIRK